MRRNKKTWALFMTVMMAVVFALAGCGANGAAPSQSAPEPGSESDSAETPAAAAGEKIEIQLATTEPEDHNVTAGAAKFKELIEEKSGGRITVKLYPNLQLGSLREQAEMTQMGSIQMTTSPLSTVSSFVADLAVMELPFLFDNEEQMWSILDAEVGRQTLATLESSGSGLTGIGLWGGGYKQMTTNARPIATPDDLAGLKIRVIPSDALIAQYKAWGANPTPIDFAELYSALQQGTVDGQENPLTTILSKKLNEVQKYLTISNHAYQYHVFMANADWFNGLSEKDRQLIAEAEYEARVYSRNLNMERAASNLEELEAQGMQVNTLTQEAVDAFRGKSAELYEQIADTEGKKTLLHAVQEAVKASE
ncbi:TRAP transporter substrate-binding protein [Paenibacillaceae bacterium WGS1546]|uniref:TRAP transporter substrate-binding protein n=1 Tax=Cohnella sp. WGS1546 TaxID=3366810 RepID=UPI00372D4AA2